MKDIKELTQFVAERDTLQARKLYDITAPNRSTGIINGSSSNVLNWDDVRYPWAFPLYKTMLANFWTPFEINMSDDIKQWYADLNEQERETFKRIIGLLAFLDSIQSDYAAKVADYLTDSSVSALMIILAQQEVVHNHSYSYVLSSLVSKEEQDEIFEYWKHDEILRERNEFIAEGYRKFTENPTPQAFFEANVLDVILEGVFFYAGFAFFYNLARSSKMMKTNQMINYINRDENVHVNIFAHIVQELLAENPELNTEENKCFITETIRKGAELENKWGEYIIGDKFDDIDMIDLSDYVKFTANKRAQQLGAEKPFPEVRTNSMKWIKIYEDPNAAKQDFFEGKPRTYAKTTNTNGFDDL